MPMDPEPPPSYIAQQPAGVFGPPRWVVYAKDGTRLTMFEPNETREDVRKRLAIKGMTLLISNKFTRSDDPLADH
jgi:hypothetical protein